MAELTKEYLDKQLGKLATKSSINNLDKKIDNLAMIVANGFAEVKRELDVRDEVAALNRRMSRIEQALNLKN